MGELLRFTVEGAGSATFETDELPSGIGQVGRREGRVRNVGLAFEDKLGEIRDAAAAALDVLRGMDPDEVKLTFAVKLTAEAGAVFARTAAEGQLGVELLWRRGEPGKES